MKSPIKEFVENLYRNILLREGEADGINGWTEQGEKGLTSIEMVNGFITSPEAQSVIEVLRLYQVFFGRAADPEGLRHWVRSLQNGMSINDLAFNFSQSEEYKQKYADMSAGDIVETFYSNLFGRQSDADGKMFWLDIVEHAGWRLDQVAAAFTVSAEALESRGNATRFAENFLALCASDGSTPATEAVKSLTAYSLAEAIAELQTVSGTVQAGMLEYVKVYRAIDERALETAAPAAVETDGSGYFAFNGGFGDFYAIGGRDITTGAANSRWLSTVAAASSGELAITPLTTIIHALVRQGAGIADAVSMVNRAFGIDPGIDLLSFRHLEKAIASDSLTVERKGALTVKAVIAQIAILTEGVAALAQGKTGNTDLDTSKISLHVADALAEKITSAWSQGKPFQPGALLALDAYDVVEDLVSNSLRRFDATGMAPMKNAAANQSDGLNADAATIIATLNTPISKTAGLVSGLSAFVTDTPIDVLSVIARIEGWATVEARRLIITGMEDGSLTNDVTALLARKLGIAVQSFEIGSIADGVASTTAQAIFDKIFNVTPPGGDVTSPWPSNPPPDFFVTSAMGVLSFGGSVTGNITLAIDIDGTISFSRGGITAATKGSVLPGVTIDLSAGQVLRLENFQLTQLTDLTVKGAGNLVFQGALTVSSRAGIHLDNHTGGISYRIQDTPANILGAASAILGGALEVTVNAGSDASYNVASATELLSRLTSTTGLTLNVVDTASNILANHAITGVNAYKMSENASNLSVANAATLVGISGFDANDKTITVQDTAEAILANHSIGGVTAYHLGDDASNLTVANAAALLGISGFHASDKNITVLDTASAILAKPSITGVTAYGLSANANDLSVAHAVTLAGTRSFNTNGKSFTVQDTAAAVLANHAITGVTAYKVLDTHSAILSNYAAMPYVSAFLLAADALDMTVADAAALSAVGRFSLNGHGFTVKDSFNAILANHAIAGVTKYKLDNTVRVQDVVLLQSENLALAKLQYTLADTAEAISQAHIDVLNSSDGVFSTASSGHDSLDLNRNGTVKVRLSLDLGPGDDTILGSEVMDHIHGNTGSDRIDGGPSQDFYTYSDKGTDSPVSSGMAAAAGFDVVDIRGGDGFYIAEFGPTAAQPARKGTLQVLLNAENPAGASGTDLLAALDIAYAAVKKDDKDVMFVRFTDGNQYLVVNDGQDGNSGINAADTVIKIIGSSLPRVGGANLVIFDA